MKKVTILSIITIMGIAVIPLTLSITQPAHAEIEAESESLNVVNSKSGSMFVGSNRILKVTKNSDGYILSIENTETGVGVTQSEGRLKTYGNRQVYTWNNSGVLYQVVWQPADPDYARFRIYSPSGDEVDNFLLQIPQE